MRVIEFKFVMMSVMLNYDNFFLCCFVWCEFKVGVIEEVRGVWFNSLGLDCFCVENGLLVVFVMWFYYL